jgi:hypothetical protein
MVVDYPAMSSVSFCDPDFCALIPDVPSVVRQSSSGSLFEDYFRIADHPLRITAL